MIAAMLQEPPQLWLILEIELQIAVDTLHVELLSSASKAFNPKRSLLQFLGDPRPLPAIRGIRIEFDEGLALAILGFRV